MVVLMLLGLCACGNNATDSDSDNGDTVIYNGFKKETYVITESTPFAVFAKSEDDNDGYEDYEVNVDDTI